MFLIKPIFDHAPIMDYSPSVKIKNFFIFISPVKDSPPHDHDFIEIMYMYSGKCEHTLNGKTFCMKKGDYIIMDHTCTHTYYAITDDFEIINCLFYPSFIDPSLVDNSDMYTVMENHLFNFKKELYRQDPIGTVFNDDDGTVRRLLTSMNNEFIMKQTGYLEIIHSYLTQLLIHTMRSIYINVKVFAEDDTVQNILKYINLNYMNDITLKGICDIYNYSVTHMCAKFKKRAGISFIEYLQKTRVENSMRLLVNTSRSVSDIAIAVGYQDMKSFYRVFKKHTGTTPADFRKNNKKFLLNDYGFMKKIYKELLYTENKETPSD